MTNPRVLPRAKFALYLCFFVQLTLAMCHPHPCACAGGRKVYEGLSSALGVGGGKGRTTGEHNLGPSTLATPPRSCLGTGRPVTACRAQPRAAATAVSGLDLPLTFMFPYIWPCCILGEIMPCTLECVILASLMVQCTSAFANMPCCWQSQCRCGEHEPCAG